MKVKELEKLFKSLGNRRRLKIIKLLWKKVYYKVSDSSESLLRALISHIHHSNE